MADEAAAKYDADGDGGNRDRSTIGPGVYEFAGFNQMIADCPPDDRASLHRHELFDEPGALIEFVTSFDTPDHFKDELQEHLNDHIRTHPINQAVSAAAWLGLRATRDGSPLKFFLRVGAPTGAKVGVVPGAEEFVAVVIEVPEDWPWLPPPLGGGPGGPVFAKLMIGGSVGSLISAYEVFDRNATAIRPGPLGLRGVTGDFSL